MANQIHSAPSASTMANTASPSGLRARLFNPAARQKLLAFASLLLMILFFSFASPNFMEVDNLVSILQSTAVNGVSWPGWC